MRSWGHDTTADEVLAEIDLTGQLVVVTGGASGLGQETARAMAARGAQIIIPVRDMAKGEAAADAIRAAVPGADVTLLACDLGSLASIREFAAAFQARFDRIDLLINNAGVMASPFMHTADGFELQFGTNHLGHFLLTNLLVAQIARGSGKRIVNLSSRGHHFAPVDFDDPNYERRDYAKFPAYGQAKTANIQFTVGLEQRLAGQGIHSYAVHPGGIQTNLGRHMTEEDIAGLMASMKARSGGEEFRWKNVEQGAATTCYAATAPELAGAGGVYCEDCHVAAVDDADEKGGVRSYAIDPDNAHRLWALSEQLVGQSFAY